MGKPIEEATKDSQQHTPGILPFAVVVGLIVFFITSEEAGGLNGVQGFFIGFFAVIFLFVMVGAVEAFLESKRQTLEGSQTSLRVPGNMAVLQALIKAVEMTSSHVPGNMAVTQQESEEALTIQIHIPKQVSLKRKVGDVSEETPLTHGG